MKRLLILTALLLASPATAQTPDPAFLQKAVAVLQQQRNAAMDGQAQAQTQAAMLADDVEKLKARVKELEKSLSSEMPK